MDFKALSRLTRFKEIIIIFLKYGFGDLIVRLDLPGSERIRRLQGPSKEIGTYGRIRHALEELGPTFVKFGQIMSLRPDLLPQPLVHELSKLQDEVAPVEFQKVERVVTQSLGRSLKEVFRVFDPEPIAAASLSQVHRAVLRENGVVVAVKVRRPGIKRKVESDFDILTAIVDRLHSHIQELKIYDLPSLLRLTKSMLTRELDFKLEGRYTRIAKTNLMTDNRVVVPEVYEDYCREQLLVMEYIHGDRVKEISSGTLQDPESLAKSGMRTAIRQILEHGFFHADPHPGNFLITADNRLCLIDWGMIGRLTKDLRYELIDLIHAIVDHDTDKLVDMLVTIARTDKDIDKRELERDVLDILDFHISGPLNQLNLGQLLLSITNLLKKHQLRLPVDLGIMIKALITAEGAARLIYPSLDVIETATPDIKALAQERYKPQILGKMFFSKMAPLISAHGNLPGRIAQIIEKVDGGKLSIRFEHENLGRLTNSLENSSNRLTLGIIIGALIIGSSMIITTGIGPLLLGFPALGVIGYLISGCLGLWLIFTIIRNRRF